MKRRILYVERRPVASPSIERVFRQIAKGLPPDEFDVQFQSVPFGDSLFGVFGNLLFFRPSRADIYHITGHVHYIALRLPKASTVLTFHDLILAHIRRGLRLWAIRKLYILWPLRRLRFITAISDFTAAELREFGGADAAKTMVIWNPAIDGFDPEPRRPFCTDRPVVLHIGTAPNKNLFNLIRALEGITCTLRIIGPLDAELHKAIRVSGVEMQNIVGLEQAGMQREYRNCDIVSFCTTYEGFGLPILEAQAMAKPLITSDLEPMRTIAGDGALFVDPANPDSIRSAIKRMTEDAQLRESLIRAGLRNTQRFSAVDVASKYADLYRRMLQSQ